VLGVSLALPVVTSRGLVRCPAGPGGHEQSRHSVQSCVHCTHWYRPEAHRGSAYSYRGWTGHHRKPTNTGEAPSRVRHLIPALPGRPSRIHAVPSITNNAHPWRQAPLRCMKMSIKEINQRDSLALPLVMSRGTCDSCLQQDRSHIRHAAAGALQTQAWASLRLDIALVSNVRLEHLHDQRPLCGCRTRHHPHQLFSTSLESAKCVPRTPKDGSLGYRRCQVQLRDSSYRIGHQQVALLCAAKAFTWSAVELYL
jgi:hypothetical protein